MIKSFIIWYSVLIALVPGVIFSQSIRPVLMYKLRYDSLYGTDPLLFNGIKYFPEHTVTRGFPWWKDDRPMTADIVYSGRSYENLQIRYNLYSQQFILEYADRYGALKQILLNRLKIDSVFIEDGLFVKNRFSDIKAPFLQVIHEDKISCYFTLEKTYRFDNSGIDTGYEYSDEKLTSYVVKSGKAYVFNGRSGFLKLFQKDKRKLIRSYIKENGIKVGRRIPADLTRLCIFCNKLCSP